MELDYNIVQRADWPPSRCCVCSGSDGPFIDTGARFPAYPQAPTQRVFICVPCGQQIARSTLGFLDPADAERLNAKLEAKELELHKTREDLREAQQDLQNIAQLRRKGFEVLR